MANTMESIRQKTITLRRERLSVAAVLTFVLLITPALYYEGSFKVVRVTDGDTIKVRGIGNTNIISLVDIDATATLKKTLWLVNPYDKISRKTLPGLFKINSSNLKVGATTVMGCLSVLFL
jgi:endonuclease YncB( thermonuclease family)